MFPGLRLSSSAIPKIRPLISGILGSAALLATLSPLSHGVNVPTDTQTLVPDLQEPQDNAYTTNNVLIGFNLPEAAQPGSVKLTFGTTVLTLASTEETAGMHIFEIDPRNPASSPKVASVVNGPIPDGEYTVSVSYKDVLGNPEASDSSVEVTVDASADFTELYKKGAPVPGAGVDDRIQAGALWTGFGAPTINDAGMVAFIGKWKAPAVTGENPLPAQTGTGIFVNDRLVTKVGEYADGTYTFKAFRDPVLDNAGRVAFIATVAGFDVNSTNDTVVAKEGALGGVRLVAQEGHEAAGTGGAVFKALTSVSIKSAPDTNTIVFTGTLKTETGSPGVVSATDAGAWVVPPFNTDPMLLVREGDPGFQEGEKIKSFSILKALGGSPAQGRGHIWEDDVVAQVTLSTGRNAIVVFRPGTGPEVLTMTGDEVGNPFEAQWLRLGMPSVGRDLTVEYSMQPYAMTVLGTMKTGPGGVTSADARGIFEKSIWSSDWNDVARLGEFASGINGTYKSFKDPIHAPGPVGLAFLGTVAGFDITTANNECLWWCPTSTFAQLIAREGDDAPAPEDAKWKSFSSVVLPGSGLGPVFLANLQKGTALVPGPGGITSIDDYGLYATYRTGEVVELVRENQPLLGKKVKNFRVLKASAGSAGVGRSNNTKNSLVLFVTYSDSSTALVRIDLPAAPAKLPRL